MAAVGAALAGVGVAEVLALIAVLAAKHASRTTHKRANKTAAARTVRALRLLAAVVVLLRAAGVGTRLLATTVEDARHYLPSQLATDSTAAASMSARSVTTRARQPSDKRAEAARVV